MNQRYTHDYFEHSLIFLLMAGFLLVDSMVGVIEIYLGMHIKASLIYKTPVLLLIMLVIAQRDIVFFGVILSAIILLMISATVKLTQFSDLGGYVGDFTYVLKLLSPLIYYKYFQIVCDEIPYNFEKAGPALLSVNFVVLVGNIILGTAGLGYASYSSEGGNIGVNGFFGAGNELGAVFVVLASFMLVKAYLRGLPSYVGMSLLIFTIGALISTKTSILSAVLIIFLLPVFIQGKAYFKPTSVKLSIAFLLLTIIVLAGYFLVDTLKNAGLWQRIVWLYQEYGIWRVILSSRDLYAQELLGVFAGANVFEWLFGLSKAGLNNYWQPIKPLAEVDPVDTLVIFGFIGLLIATLVYVNLFYDALRQRLVNPNPVSSAALLSVFILIALSLTSGHIWFSGMVGPFVGILMGLSYLATQRAPEYEPTLSQETTPAELRQSVFPASHR